MQSHNPHQAMHTSKPRIGVLFVNLGSPSAPTTAAVRRYLGQFLSDKRVIELPGWLWQPILKACIIPIRAPRTRRLYQKIWTDAGSPLVSTSQALARRVRTQLSETEGSQVIVDVAMRYGQPSVDAVTQKLLDVGIEKLIVLPLYPQYSATTTATVLDAISECLQRQRIVPALKFINSYFDDPNYIQAVVQQIREHWQTHTPSNKLLFSFHGLPQAYVDKGDPYARQCYHTAKLIAEALALAPTRWQVVFQSRFGRTPWLQPYCDVTLQQLAADGIQHVDVVCPGFPVDCLETLEEMAMTNRELFLAAGGQRFHYIPALNAGEHHVDFWVKRIKRELNG